MKRSGVVGALALTLALSACGGGDHVRVDLPGGEDTLDLVFPANEAVRHTLPLRVRGGLPPFETRLEGCPGWVQLLPDQNILAGTAPLSDAARVFVCRYIVEERAPSFRPARRASYGLRLIVRAPQVPALRIHSPAGTRAIVVGLVPERAAQKALPITVSGGFRPYHIELAGCPAWVQLVSARVLAGTAPRRASGESFFCRYQVTESDPVYRAPHTVSQGLEIRVGHAEAGRLRVQPGEDGSVWPLDFSPGGARQHTLPFQISGGVPPYETRLEGCPEWAVLATPQVLGGTPPASEEGRSFFCRYVVTEADPEHRPPDEVSRGLRLNVGTSGAVGRLAVTPEEGSKAKDVDFAPGQASERDLGFQITGGVKPYSTELEGCPEWLSLTALARVAGTPPASDGGKSFFCNWVVTEADPGHRRPDRVTRALRVNVGTTEGGDLSVDWSGGSGIRTIDFAAGQVTTQALEGGGGFTVTGGVRPLTRALEGCPTWVTLAPDEGATIAGTAPISEIGRSFFCNYVVTESDPGHRSAQSVARGLELKVIGAQTGSWRFATRTTEGGEHPISETDTNAQAVAVMPYALGGDPSTTETYTLNVRAPLSFAGGTRTLSYTKGGADPLLDTVTTYVYEVFAENAATPDDGLCIDISYIDKDPIEEPNDKADGVRIVVRDDARRNSNDRYECPDRAPEVTGSSRRSNPVHEALGPVHARRATARAHEAVRTQVRAWTGEGGAHAEPSVHTGRLSGKSGGLHYSGTSRWAGMGAHAGQGTWQAGVVAGITATELDYDADEALEAQGYKRGEHETQITGVHPFVAWHWSEEGHAWASVGVGTGTLRHRDDLGFRTWSSSTLALRAWALGASMTLARLGGGTLETEGGVEGFALNIEGGDQISRSLPTMRGRDARAAVRWAGDTNARWVPEVALGYRHERDDGGRTGKLETRIGLRLQGVGHPRVSARLGLDGARSVDGDDAERWGVSAALRLAPKGETHGLDAELSHAGGDDEAREGLRAEVGYRMGRVRPYARIEHDAAGAAARRALGIALIGRPETELRAEVAQGSEDVLRVVLRLAL